LQFWHNTTVIDDICDIKYNTQHAHTISCHLNKTTITNKTEMECNFKY